MKTLKQLIKPARIDNKFDDHIRSVLTPKFEFIDLKREALKILVDKRLPKDHKSGLTYYSELQPPGIAERNYNDMITTEKKIENVMKLIENNYINSQCEECKLRFTKYCKSKDARSFLDKKGNETLPMFSMKTVACSYFQPYTGKPDDYEFFKNAHSTTVEITDLTLSNEVEGNSTTNFNTAWTGDGQVLGSGTYLEGMKYADKKPAKYYNYRGFFLFDTSAIPLGNIINDGHFYVCGAPAGIGRNCYVRDGQPTWPANPVNLASYNPTNYSGYQYGTLTPLANREWGNQTFDYSMIVLGGVTKHMFELIDTSSPALGGSTEGFGYHGPLNGSGNDPELHITYSAPVGSSPFSGFPNPWTGFK